MLALIGSGLEDFSVSRSTERARGWGIPVPGDPDQVIYVWWDALGNYLTALDYAKNGENLEPWWTNASRRIHLLGKGVLRFHAVYWPAMLLSAGEAVPTNIVVHGYLTENGRKISKSTGATVDPYDLVARYGTDAVRWWLLREVPKGADADFTVGRLVGRANDELANGFGNLVNRVVSMIHRYSRRTGPARDGNRSARSESPPRGHQQRARPDRRGPRRLRLPPRHRSSLAHRRRGEPLRQPHPPVVPGQGRQPRRASRRPLHPPGRLPGNRHAPAPLPPGRRGPHHKPVHPERGRVPPGPVPAPAEAHPASLITARSAPGGALLDGGCCFRRSRRAIRYDVDADAGTLSGAGATAWSARSSRLRPAGSGISMVKMMPHR